MDLTRKGLLNTILLPPLFLVSSKFPIWAKIEMVVVKTRLGFTDKKKVLRMETPNEKN